MKLINLSRQYSNNKNIIDKNIKKTLDNTDFILGENVNLLEKKLAKFSGSKYCLTVGNGTDALLIALMALGIQKKDEIITTSFSFISAVEVIKFIGAKPILVDINLDTANMNSKLIEEKITKKTKAILIVNLFGNIVNFNEIQKISKKYKLKIIEDAAQSFGAKYKNKMSGNLGDLSCTSFFPTKSLGCYGDGGAIFCNNTKYYKLIKRLRNHGQTKKYQYNQVGLNSRLDTIQASILLSKLIFFKKELRLRRKKYQFYKKNFSVLISKKKISLIKISNGVSSCYSYFNIVVNKNRNKLENYLTLNKIPFQIYYPKPLNEYKYLKIKEKNHFKNSKDLSKRIISLPFDPYIKNTEQLLVVKTIEKFFDV